MSEVVIMLAIAAILLVAAKVAGRFLRGKKRHRAADNGKLPDAGEQQRLYREALQMATQPTSDRLDVVGRNVEEHVAETEQNDVLFNSFSDQDDVDLKAQMMAAIATMSDANGQLQRQLQDAQAKLADQSLELAIQATIARTDPLTGLLNRRAFDDELCRRVSEFQRYHVVVSLLLADIDHFKTFNDIHGHQAGDEVLRCVAQAIKRSMRSLDLVCRYGGDEIAVIMPATNLAGAGLASDRARVAVEQAIIEHRGEPMKVTFSCGVTSSISDDGTESMIRRVDDALYASKKAGRNCLYLHDGVRCLPIANQPAAPAPNAEPPKKAGEESAR